MNINIEIRNFIKKRREYLGWSQRRVVDEMGEFGVRIVPDTYARFERGERGLYADEFVALLFVLGIGMTELLGMLNSMHEMPASSEIDIRSGLCYSAYAIQRAKRRSRPSKNFIP